MFRTSSSWTVTSVLVIALLALSSPALAGLADNILGKWRYEGKQGGAAIESVAEFKADGAYHCNMKVRIFGARKSIQFAGKWRIEGDSVVIIEVTQTTSPLFLPKGKVMRKEQVEIRGELMTYRYGGNVEKERRVTLPPGAAEPSENVKASGSRY